MTCFHYCPNPPCLLSSIGTRVYLLATWPLQDIRLLRSCRALLNHPFIPPPTCIAHPGAILLHNYWTVCDFPSDHPLYGIHHTILVLTILCRGQLATPLAYLLLRTHPTARLPTNPPHRPPPLVYRILATPLSSSLTRNSLHRPPLVYRTMLVERLRAAALLSTGHSPRIVFWPLHDIVTTSILCCMAKQGRRGETVNCALLIATYNGEGLQYTMC